MGSDGKDNRVDVSKNSMCDELKSANKLLKEENAQLKIKLEKLETQNTEMKQNISEVKDENVLTTSTEITETIVNEGDKTGEGEGESLEEENVVFPSTNVTTAAPV